MKSIMSLNAPGDYGLPTRSFALITKTVMIVVQMGFLGPPRLLPGVYAPIYDLHNMDPHLWVYDKATGEKLAEIELPSNASGAPISYVTGGKQYIAFPVGGGPVPEELGQVGVIAEPQHEHVVLAGDDDGLPPTVLKGFLRDHEMAGGNLVPGSGQAAGVGQGVVLAVGGHRCVGLDGQLDNQVAVQALPDGGHEPAAVGI